MSTSDTPDPDETDFLPAQYQVVVDPNGTEYVALDTDGALIDLCRPGDYENRVRVARERFGPDGWQPKACPDGTPVWGY